MAARLASQSRDDLGNEGLCRCPARLCDGARLVEHEAHLRMKFATGTLTDYVMLLY